MKSPTMLRNLLLASLASLSLGGCYYGDVYGSSYADADCYARYGDQYWVNDPHAYDDGYYGYDCYDAADYRSGFVQIGFGGGWHQNLYYPGYGLFLFDRYGRRHAMSHDYLTYWGGRRAWWKHHGHRYRDHDRPRGDGRHDGWRPGRGYGRGDAAPPPGVNNGWNNGPAAIPTPRERPRGDGWRGRPRGNFDGGTGTPPPAAAPLPPVTSPDAAIAPAPRGRRGGNGWGGHGAGQGGDGWTAPPAAAAPPPHAPYNPELPRQPRAPRFTQPAIGNDGASATPFTPAPRAPSTPRYVPTESYSPPAPPPPSTRSEAPSRDQGGPIRED